MAFPTNHLEFPTNTVNVIGVTASTNTEDPMSERDTYPAGVPCWVTNLQHDVPAATAFYQELFGWETESGPADLAAYALGRLRGRDVAAIGTIPDPETSPAWVTEIRTADLAATVVAVRGPAARSSGTRWTSARSDGSASSSIPSVRRSARGRRATARVPR